MTRIAKLKDVLKQYRITHWVENDKTYKQVTISQTGDVFYRGEKEGIHIGRKRQFLIDLKKYPNTLIFIRQGVFKGGIGIATKEVDDCLVTENMPMFDIVNIEPEYLSFYLKSPQFISAVNTLVPLGTAQKAIHERQLLELEIPLPDKEDQKEIIHKLKIIGDKYKILSNNSTKNYDYIQKLRQSILQEAVSGKLVPQDPKDEPASELLKKIQAEKEKLIREGKIRKDKPLPAISKEEIPYELPKGWEWVRLGEITKIIAGNAFSSHDFNLTNGIKAIKITNCGVKQFIESEDYLPKGFIEKYPDFIVNEGDLVIALTRPYLANGLKVCVCPKSYNNSLLNQRVASIKNIHKLNFDYMFYYLISDYVLNKYKSRFNNTGLQPNLKMEDLTTLEIPLPPLFEQKRIIQKVNQLMKLCNELEEKVKENQKNSELLMESVLKEAFEEKLSV